MGFGHHHHHPHHGHGQGHDHDHDHGDHAPRALTRALFITVAFMVIEALGGYLSNSLALLSDAAHMLTDVGAMLLSLFVYWLARRPSTPSMSFGYHRVEILGALASGLAIWILAGFLVYEAVLRMSAPPEVRGPIVFVVAAFGLGANLMSMRMLHVARDENINVRAAYLHVLSDLLGSVGALIAGGVLWFTGWRPIDPIMTVLVAALMLMSSWRLVRESVGVLMESAPGHLDPEQVKRDLRGIEGVQEVHDLHIWTVSSGRVALSVHLISTDSEATLARAHRVLESNHGIIHTTIQVEHPAKFASARCYDCG